MLRTITPSEMKRVETRAIDEGAASGETLMQRAAAHVADAVEAAVRETQLSGQVVCICGTGNNGGDGLAAARILSGRMPERSVAVWLMGGVLSPDAERERERLQREASQVYVQRVEGTEENDEGCLPLGTACVVDALFGTGLSREVTGTAAFLCHVVNEAKECGVPVVAVDIPSGLNGETGKVMGCAVHATQTITFHRPKSGLYLGMGPDRTGEIKVGDIGLPNGYDDAQGFWVAEEGDVSSFFPPRVRVSHKGSYGRVLIVAGSRGMAGAAAVCALAALRTGAGLVTIACPDAIVDTLQQLCPCATCLPLPADDGDAAWTLLLPALEKADALAFGCGLGTGDGTRMLAMQIFHWLSENKKPAVLDADALTLLAAQKTDIVFEDSCILTPHPAEAARLLGTTVAQVLTDAPKAARAIRAKYGAAVVLKGATSVLLSGQEEGLNVLGTPAMAKGGSGDALTGVLAALLAESAQGALSVAGLSLLQAGCALHGLAGVAAAERYGERGMLATDLVQELGRVGQRGRSMEAARMDITPKPHLGLSQKQGKQKQIIFHQESLPSHSENAKFDIPPSMGNPSPLGRYVWVTVDRKLGTPHPLHREVIYPLNYGYVQEVLAETNEWQDAYILGVQTPVEVFEGEVIAVIRRLNDGQEIWAVATAGVRMTEEEIRAATDFQERFFDIAIECLR